MQITKLKTKLLRSEMAKMFIQNTFWSIFGSIVSKVIVFMTWVIVGRILGSSNYGNFGIIRDSIVMFSSFAGLGLGLTASKFVAEYLEHDKEKASRIIGLTMLFGIIAGVVVGGSVFISAPLLSQLILNNSDFTNDMRIASIMLFFSSLNGAQIGALQGLSAYKTIAKINIWQALSCAPVLVLATYWGGLHGSVVGFAFYNVIICVFSHNALKKESERNGVCINYRDCLKESHLFWSYSFPAFLSGVLVTPMKWISEVILINVPNGSRQLGIFMAAQTLGSIFLMFTTMLNAPFITAMAKHRTDDINNSFNRLNIIAPWAIGLFLTLPFMFFPEIGELVWGKDYSGSSFRLCFVLTMFFNLIMMYKQGIARILSVHDLQWLGVLSNTLWGLSLLGGIWLLKSFGAIGLAGSYVFAYVISTIVVLPFYQRRKLIPRNTVFSKYALLLWCITIGVLFLSIDEVPVFTRGILFLLAVPMYFLIFKKYIQQEKL